MGGSRRNFLRKLDVKGCAFACGISRHRLAPCRWRCGTKSRVCRKQRQHGQHGHDHDDEHIYVDHDGRQQGQQHQPAVPTRPPDSAPRDEGPAQEGRSTSSRIGGDNGNDISGDASYRRSGRASSLSEAEAGHGGTGLSSVVPGRDSRGTGATEVGGGSSGWWYRWRRRESALGGGAAVGEVEGEGGEAWALVMLLFAVFHLAQRHKKAGETQIGGKGCRRHVSDREACEKKTENPACFLRPELCRTGNGRTSGGSTESPFCCRLSPACWLQGGAPQRTHFSTIYTPFLKFSPLLFRFFSHSVFLTPQRACLETVFQV